MIELKNIQLLEVDGGASFMTASFINAISRAASTIMDIGRSLGSAIRRAFNGSYCSI